MSRISLPLILYSFTHLSHRLSQRRHRFTCRLTTSTTTGGGGDMSRWWSRAAGQRFNPAGVGSFAGVIAREPHLALPHVSVPDIRWIDWAEIERLGFTGVVFDKDNTLTAPYSENLWPSIAASFRRCSDVFPGRIAIFSNSAGLYQYDPDGIEARALEDSIGGVHVIRHEMKKPAGTTEDIERYFGCSASLLVMVGDRIFTDVVYGNRNGFLTILTEPLSPSRESFIVKQVRKLEGYLIDRWLLKGLKPAMHNLLPDAQNPHLNQTLQTLIHGRWICFVIHAAQLSTLIRG